MKIRVFGVLALAMVLAAQLAHAQASAFTVIRGTIVTASATSLNLTAPDGSTVVIELAPAAKVTEIVPSRLSDVKAGSYVGTAAVREPNGQYRAMELQVFPESMRGVGLGTRPWNLTSQSSMTNGTVGSMTQTNGTVGNIGGTELTVNDGSGTKTVLVPASVPVVTYQPGTAAELTPGAHVILFAVKGSDGHLTTSHIQVGKDGLTPPM
jgi:methionine-rich copper-binding protein CopC